MKDLQDIGIGSVVVGAFIGLGCLTHAFPKESSWTLGGIFFSSWRGSPEGLSGACVVLNTSKVEILVRIVEGAA